MKLVSFNHEPIRKLFETSFISENKPKTSLLLNPPMFEKIGKTHEKRPLNVSLRESMFLEATFSPNGSVERFGGLRAHYIGNFVINIFLS